LYRHKFSGFLPYFVVMRALRLLLPVFYVLSSLPVQASYHYCLGRVKQISFYEVNDPNCVCPAEEDYGDCCDTEHAVLDFQDDHTQVAKAVFEPIWVGISSPVFSVKPAEIAYSLPAEPAWRGPPQATQEQQRYLRLCNFRL